MVDQIFQMKKRAKLVKLLKTLDQITIDEKSLETLLYNESINADFGEKHQSWKFLNSLNSGVQSSRKCNALAFSNMTASAVNLIANCKLGNLSDYQAREISEDEIMQYYRNDEAFVDKVKDRMSEFLARFVPLFNESKLSEDDIEKVIRDNYCEGFFKHIQQNPTFVSILFTEAKSNAIKRRYIENMLDSLPGTTFAKELKKTFDDISEEDFRKEMFVEPDGRSVCRKSIADLLRVIHELDFGYIDEAKMGMQYLIDSTIVSKFMSIHDEEYKKEYESKVRDSEADWLSKIKFFDLDLDRLLSFAMDCYRELGYGVEIDNDFIEYLKNNDLTEVNIRHMFGEIYDIFNNGDESASKYVQFINFIKSPMKEFAEQKRIEESINGIKIPESLEYIRSKAQAQLDKKLEREYLRKRIERDSTEITSEYWNAEPLQMKIMDTYAEDKERIDGEILKYFEERIKNKTGHNMARGILSEEFLDEHAFDLIKIVANSDYDEKTAMQIIDDILKKDRVVEPNM